VENQPVIVSFALVENGILVWRNVMENQRIINGKSEAAKNT
jgi:hypothetical protein